MRQKRYLKQFQKILLRVKSLGGEMRRLSDGQLSHLTVLFKERLGRGESLDDILPEAYAAICEADWRVLGKFPFDVQIMGAIALHRGMLAEMNTGEGKTLTATMPLYLNALSGKSTILLTANEYLAWRDAREMGQVYRFMGLSAEAAVDISQSGEKAEKSDKKKIYAADIVYTTHGGLGFDYLINNLVTSASDRFLREFYYVIVDEADSVLLDGAQTPLIISGSPRVQSNLYSMADFFVTTLEEGRDYEKEEGSVWLTEEGVHRAEHYFQIDNFYRQEYFEINRHVTLALRAHALFENKKDYMISDDGRLNLLNGGSGRVMRGVKLRGGQHQALEAKEGLELSPDGRAMASVTFQNLFLMFPKMAGMSGTIADSAGELKDIYHREMMVIPPNRPVKRKDLKDRYYRSQKEQFQAAMEETLAVHGQGRPVLMVVSTIEETELASACLAAAGIPHSVLNAANAFWEAEIIKEAGQRNAVTVSTSMAGRGTDIKLGEGVRELGGLAVIAVGRMGSIRDERQARGRAGRQGDPGTSQFFVSLQDRVVEDNWDKKKLEKYVEGRKRIGRRKLKKIIDRAQAAGEELAALARRQSVCSDQIMQRQRELMYDARNRLLDGEGMDEEKVMEIARENIRGFVHSPSPITAISLNRYILDHISYRLDREAGYVAVDDPAAVGEYLMGLAKKSLGRQKEKLGGSGGQMNRFARVAALSAIDEAWVEQVDYMQQIHSAVAGRAWAQRNLIFEFQKEGFQAFQKMRLTILENIMRNVLLSNVYIDEENQLHIQLP